MTALKNWPTIEVLSALLWNLKLGTELFNQNIGHISVDGDIKSLAEQGHNQPAFVQVFEVLERLYKTVFRKTKVTQHH